MTDAGGTRRGVGKVLRNTSHLLVAQVLAAPLAVLVNAVVARSLGAADYGLYFQAMTFASFAFLFVEWGQPALLTGRVATHRDRAGDLLGSGLAFRLAVALVVVVLVPVIVLMAGYEPGFVEVLVLALVTGLVGTVAGACQDVIRGFERTDVAAGFIVGAQVFALFVIVPVLLLGGGLRGLMVAQATATAFAAGLLLWLLPRLGVPRLGFRADVVQDLWRSGHPFFVFALVLALQPTIETVMLSRFSSAEEMGWFAAARKLAGILMLPATALLAALYPTLCRLRSEDEAAYRATAAEALNLVALVAVPVALCCALFPEIGVGIFGLDTYAPAQDNLRVLAAWLLLVYFTMPVGSALTAAGRQRVWTVVLVGGIAISTVLNSFLIRWFSERMGNGGMGVCVSLLAGELVILAGALCCLPGGVLGRVDTGRLLKTLVAGGALAAAALLTGSLNVFVSAALSLAAYVLFLLLAGVVSVSRLRGYLNAGTHMPR